jgi:hypothetical protein
VPHWAEAYLGVACLLHMLWFFSALMWLAAVHLRTVHHRNDELSRAMAKQEALHVKVAAPKKRSWAPVGFPLSTLN